MVKRQPQEETGMKLGRKTLFQSQVPERGAPCAIHGPRGSIGFGLVAQDRTEGRASVVAFLGISIRKVQKARQGEVNSLGLLSLTVFTGLSLVAWYQALG